MWQNVPAQKKFLRREVNKLAEYTLKIGEIKKSVEINAGTAKKSILEIRNALRAKGIEADVVVNREPKVLD